MGSSPIWYEQRNSANHTKYQRHTIENVAINIENATHVHVPPFHPEGEREEEGEGEGRDRTTTTARKTDGHHHNYDSSDPFELQGDVSVASSKDTDTMTAIYHGRGHGEATPASANNYCSSSTTTTAGHWRSPSVEEDNHDNHDNHDDDDDNDKSGQATGGGDDGGEPSRTAQDEKSPVTWSSLPKKGQLAILTFARLSEPVAQTSLQAYIFYQLRSFDPSLPDSTISSQAGILQGCFTAAQFLTAVWWGRLADAEWMGRKKVLLIGLTGTCISCLGFGFSRSFVAAAVFRTLGGILNSNVGVMRTMIAEIIEEKKYQSRAFLLLPMCFNIGVIIGPIFGGVLADPVRSYPKLLGPGTLLGGKYGIQWMLHWPFAFPNILSALFIFASLLAVFLGLDETHPVGKYRSDWGRKMGESLKRTLWLRRIPPHYRPLTDVSDHDDDDASLDLEENGTTRSSFSGIAQHSLPFHPSHQRPSWRQIWTPNILLTLLVHFLVTFHTSAFNAMTFVFLPTPRALEGTRNGFLHFSGGLGLPSSRVGLATAIIGIIGLPLQIFLYPYIQSRLGTLTSFRIFLPFSPVAYVLMPFVVLLPRLPWVVWPAFTVIVGFQVISRTFSLPAAIILVNNCVTDSTVLGTIHGVAQSVSSAARTLGPFLGGWGLGLGLKENMVGGVWWALAVESLVGWVMLWSIYEGKGIEKKKTRG